MCRQVIFINAIEESAQNRPVHILVAAREIKGETELREVACATYRQSTENLNSEKI